MFVCLTVMQSFQMEQLIVVFTNKRHIGLTVIPYFASFHENQPISLHEHATPQHLEEQPGRFSIQEEAVIRLLAKISEQNLFRKYGREGTLKERSEERRVGKECREWGVRR